MNNVNWPNEWINNITEEKFQYWEDSPIESIMNDRKNYHILLKGGESSGKTTIGVIYALEKIRKGNSGMLMAADGRSLINILWRTFKGYVNKEMVVPSHRYMLDSGWRPTSNFMIRMLSESGEIVSVGFCSSPKEPMRYEGPNWHFVVLDSAERYFTRDLFSMVRGRIRLAGKNDETPQCLITAIPSNDTIKQIFQNSNPDSIEFDPEYDPEEDILYGGFKGYSTYYRMTSLQNQSNSSQFLEMEKNILTNKEYKTLVEGYWG